MRFKRTKASLAVLGLALSLAACGDAGTDTKSVDVEVSKDAKFDPGTRMAELADKGTINVGVKYDQPGLGFNETGSDMPKGFDVDIAKILVASLGIDPNDTSKTKYIETISDNREPFLAGGQGRPRARVVLHHRRASCGGRPGRPVHDHRPAAARPRGLEGHRPLGPEGQGGLLGDGLHLARQRQGRRA